MSLKNVLTRILEIPPTAVGGSLNSNLHESHHSENPPNGSWGMVKVQPSARRAGWILTIPHLPLRGFGDLCTLFLGWALTIPQLPLGGLRSILKRRPNVTYACRKIFFLLALLLLLSSSIAHSQTADSWPQFRANYNLTGVSPSTVPDTLKLLWTYEAGESIESSAAIADGTAYVGSGTGDLHAVDLWTGKGKWKYKTKEAILESSPAVGGGMVFVGDSGGVFHAVNAATGKGVWTYKTDAEIKSSPVIVGDKVLIGSYDGSLYCFRMRDGKTAWRLKTENYVHGTPAVVDGVAYFAGCDEVFHGIRIADGKEVTKIPAGGNTASS